MFVQIKLMITFLTNVFLFSNGYKHNLYTFESSDVTSIMRPNTVVYVSSYYDFIIIGKGVTLKIIELKTISWSTTVMI